MNAAFQAKQRPSIQARIGDRVPGWAGPAILGLPGVIVAAVFFVLPVGFILAGSLFSPQFTLAQYVHVLGLPVYWLVFWVSFKIALVSTLACLLASYLLATTLLFARPTTRSIMLAAILVPFWTNVLIRCYAWILILQKSGLANSLLVNTLHIFTQPLPLLFNFSSVIIGLIHYLIPVATLVLYTSMQRIDLRLLQAATGLGANPLRAFLAVFVPLSLPGLFATSMLIFVIALGFFITPALLGGPQEMTLAMQVSTYFTDTVDWGLGSALASILLAFTLAFILAYLIIQRRSVSR